MEPSFQAVEKILANELKRLNLQCDRKLRALSAENEGLRRDLAEAQSRQYTPFNVSRSCTPLPMWKEEAEPFAQESVPFRVSMLSGIEGIDIGFQTPRLPETRPAGDLMMPRQHGEQSDSLPRQISPGTQLSISPRPQKPISPRPQKKTTFESSGNDDATVMRNASSLMASTTSRECGTTSYASDVFSTVDSLEHSTTESLQRQAALEGKLLKESMSNLASIFGSYQDSEGNHVEKQETIAISKWALFYKEVTSNKSKSRHTVKVKLKSLHLRKFWVVGADKRDTVHNPKLAVKSYHSEITNKSALDGHRVGSTIYGDGFLSNFVIKPDGRICLLFALVQSAFILFDVLFFPMSVFDADESSAMSTIMITTTIFWTFDLLITFIQGYHSKEGTIDMRPRQIARHYLRTWLAFDILVVGNDWFTLALFIAAHHSNSDASVFRATKLGKASRVLRGGRVLRLAKQIEKLHALLDATASADSIMVMARICCLMATILVINHYIACGWYGVAKAQSDEPALTWVKVRELEDATTFNRYFYSLHWALTQFTPCTNDIAPANGTERCFACFIVLFALIVFSTFLSSLTSALMQIKKLNFERYHEEVQIRDFMASKQVPLDVANRVWLYFRRHYKVRRRVAHESNIAFFRAIPKSLRRDLHTYVYLTKITMHPLFTEISRTPNQSVLLSMCTLALAELSPANGYEVFLEGDHATHMFFVLAGDLTYCAYGIITRIIPLSFLSEQALWLNSWEHAGHLTVNSNQCELLMIDVVNFEACIGKYVQESVIRSLRKYASLYAQYVEDNLNIGRGESLVWAEYPSACNDCWNVFNDLPLTKTVQEALASRAFQRHLQPTDSQASNQSGYHKKAPLARAGTSTFVRLLGKVRYSVPTAPHYKIGQVSS